VVVSIIVALIDHGHIAFILYSDCKNLAPEWARAATELKGKVKLGVVDATVHTQLAQRYGVQGFPTIKMFPSGKKNGQAEEYDGGRTSSVCSS
jgi:protein disulfide-isomerase A6